MKKVLLFASALVCSITYAQDCSKIFISEYVEGFGNNKALEIYNPTANTVDLSQYFVGRLNNGTSISDLASNMCVQLSGTIAPYSTHVGVIDKRDPNGVDQESPVWDELQALADQFYCPDYNVSYAFYWNGNDCIVLAKGSASNPQAATTEIVDYFGKDGQDPVNGAAGTNGWSSISPFNMTSGNPMDRVVTQDHSMIRKATVLKGKQSIAELLSPTYVFNPLTEYDSIPAVLPKIDEFGDTVFQSDGVTPQWVGNWNSLGSHACNCAPDASIAESSLDNVSIYPNPSNGVFYVNGAIGVSSIEVYNSLGQKIVSVRSNTKPIVVIDLKSNNGLYIVKLVDEKGNSTTKRVIIK